MIETEDAMPCNNKKGASPKSRPASFRRGCMKGPLLVQLSDSLRNCKNLDANCTNCNLLAIEKGLVFAGTLHHFDTRSEENTSALQSLMRISSAVSSYKKTNL